MALLDVVDGDVRILGLIVVDDAGEDWFGFPKSPVGKGDGLGGGSFLKTRQNKLDDG